MLQHMAEGMSGLLRVYTCDEEHAQWVCHLLQAVCVDVGVCWLGMMHLVMLMKPGFTRRT
jgi:hypothetical protein